MTTFEMVVGILGGLALFLFGMKLMSDGLQMVAGEKLRQILGAMTANRFLGVGTGLLVTCGVQSSSVTTVMLVGFVHAGLLNINQAVGVIMGANIGTTFTGWLVALLGFKIQITSLALPAITIGFLMRILNKSHIGEWGNVIIGFGVLFLGLDFMKDSVAELKDSPTVIGWIAGARADSLLWRIGAVGVGTAVTLIVQSSSATMAVTMTILAQGLIDFPTACALVLGENIGTTVTANIAALGATVAAKRAARAHFLFNFFGVIWAVLLFVPFMRLVEAVVPGEAVGPTGLLSQTVVASQLAAFHTLFNIINTGLFLPFANALAWIATKLVADKGSTTKDRPHLLDPSLVASPPMALHAARGELHTMLREVVSMFDKILLLLSSPSEKLGKVADEVAASEQIVDDLETEISEYLVQITHLGTSLEQSHEIASMLHAVADIERMGDHCESLLRLARRKYERKLEFGEHAHKDVLEIAARCRDFLRLLDANMHDPAPDLLARARAVEESINDMRTRMRHEHIQRLNDGTCAVPPGLLFIDMVTSFEKIGDHSFNVAEMLAGAR